MSLILLVAFVQMSRKYMDKSTIYRTNVTKKIWKSPLLCEK